MRKNPPAGMPGLTLAAMPGLMLAAMLALAACAPPGGEQGQEAGPAREQALARADLSTPGARREIILYFVSDQGRLVPEKREISSAGTAGDQARRAVEALMQGPRGPLSPALPAGAGLRALYIREDGIACVDLDSGFARGLSAGSEDALLAVWSLADTLAVNFPEVRAVKILIEGEEVRDLGGHLDLSREIVPDMSLVDEGAGAQTGSAQTVP